jgi:glycosyltransferase involved in cell wall biosynthesis
MKLMINAVSAKRGGVFTYLNNVLPELSEQLGCDENSHITVWRGSKLTNDGAKLKGVEYRADERATGGTGDINNDWKYRLWFDQVRMPRILRAEGMDVLFSSANFGPIFCPCRQVLLVRNPIYFTPTYLKRMKSPKARAYYFLQRQLNIRCIKASDIVLFPTQAMMDLVANYTKPQGSRWRVAPYGTRLDLFQPAPQRQKKEGSAVRLLNISLYCDHKNFGTLFPAISKLHRDDPRRYFLQITAGFEQEWMVASPFLPNFVSERTLYRQLHAEGVVEDVNWRPYSTLPALYQQADIFVFPSYTESFGHPMVEAMATGLPIVAADVPVNREICGESAIYFPPFDVAACAEAIKRVAEDGQLRERLRAEGIARAQQFTWKRHVAELVKAFRE